MKIVTVNIPESYLEDITRLLDNKKHRGGLYPSRSELIRVAVRDFLIKELKNAKEMLEYHEEKLKLDPIDDKFHVHVPTDKLDESGELVREFKTYKILKRLEY